ncbi:MAG TPA: cation transporter [Acidimicrobiales bacterium]|nr:cation transporter [Acidimicrobiales bacterium]
MTTTTYQVNGMTCGHCMQSVANEVKKIEGVTDVDVDLETGAVRITSEAPIDEAAVRAAVDEAGDYEVVS